MAFLSVWGIINRLVLIDIPNLRGYPRFPNSIAPP